MELLNDVNIRDAVNLWYNNRTEAILKYGHIRDWDVSNVTNMSFYFIIRKNLMIV